MLRSQGHVKQFFNDHQSIRNSTTVLPNGDIKSSMSTFWRIFLKVTLHLEVAILISWTVLYFCFQSIASCFPGTLIHQCSTLSLSTTETQSLQAPPLPFRMDSSLLCIKSVIHSPFPRHRSISLFTCVLVCNGRLFHRYCYHFCPIQSLFNSVT